jgi:hypothetical protein
MKWKIPGKIRIHLKAHHPNKIQGQVHQLKVQVNLRCLYAISQLGFQIFEA